jgi:hypothetical protein
MPSNERIPRSRYLKKAIITIANLSQQAAIGIDVCPNRQKKFTI